MIDKDKGRTRRVFVAVAFDAPARRAVKKIYKDLERKHWPVKWTPEKNLHVTLAFLGNLSDDEVEKVKKVAEMAAREVDPFEVGFKGWGGFPDLVLPHTIWLGLNGDLKNLAYMYKRLREQLSGNGYRLGGKPFVPHVTLGRVKRGSRRKVRLEMGRQLSKMRRLDVVQKLHVKRVEVFESKLSPKGSKYVVIEGFGLGS